MAEVETKDDTGDSVSAWQDVPLLAFARDVRPRSVPSRRFVPKVGDVVVVNGRGVLNACGPICPKYFLDAKTAQVHYNQRCHFKPDGRESLLQKTIKETSVYEVVEDSNSKDGVQPGRRVKFLDLGKSKPTAKQTDWCHILKDQATTLLQDAESLLPAPQDVLEKDAGREELMTTETAAQAQNTVDGATPMLIDVATAQNQNSSYRFAQPEDCSRSLTPDNIGDGMQMPLGHNNTDKSRETESQSERVQSAVLQVGYTASFDHMVDKTGRDFGTQSRSGQVSDTSAQPAISLGLGLQLATYNEANSPEVNGKQANSHQADVGQTLSETQEKAREIMFVVIGLAQEAHNSIMGTRFLSESDAQKHLGASLRRRPYVVHEQGVVLAKSGSGYQKRYDLLVDHLVLLELKLADGISHAHDNQLHFYMRHGQHRFGMVVCFPKRQEISTIMYKAWVYQHVWLTGREELVPVYKLGSSEDQSDVV